MGTITKVKRVQGNGDFESDFGTLQPNGKKLLFSFDYEMEDGTMLKANHKTNVSPFPAGAEVEYEITKENSFGKQGKVGKPKENPFIQNQTAKTPEEKAAIQKAIIYQSAFKEAVGFHNMTGFQGSNSKSSLEELCATADYIAQYVIKKSGI